MKIDFQTSVKSDKKSAFTYIMEGTKRGNRNMYVGTLCRGVFGANIRFFSKDLGTFYVASLRTKW